MKVELGPVQETLLIPLLGRARETQKPKGLVRDPKAVEIVEKLDYDFAKWEGARSLQGSVFRTRMYDQEVEAFLKAHPDGTVVELGCGLNTRFERLDNGRARWFDLDLPDTMQLRQTFFEDVPRRTMITASVTDTEWHAEVQATGGPWIFLSEAVLIYLEAPLVEQTIRQLVANFPGATLVIDTTSQQMVEGQSSHDVMRTMRKDSWFRWVCNNPQELSGWGLQLEASRTFLEAGDELLAHLPRMMRLVVRWAPWILRRRLDGYRINRFTLNA
ncbi:MAG: class I SAM-dependent methyltransferase [Myxococcota bacterium]